MLKISIVLLFILELSIPFACSAENSNILIKDQLATESGESHDAILSAYNNELIRSVLSEPKIIIDPKPILDPEKSGVSSLLFWFNSTLPPSSYAALNLYAVESEAQKKLKTQILAASGEMSPAKVFKEALKITDFHYHEAILITANLFKNEAGNERLAQLPKLIPLKSLTSDISSKVLDLRPPDSVIVSKLTPWAEYFSTLYAGAILGDAPVRNWISRNPSGNTKAGEPTIPELDALETLSVLTPALNKPKVTTGLPLIIDEKVEGSNLLDQVVSKIDSWLNFDSKPNTPGPDSLDSCKENGKIEFTIIGNCNPNRLLWLNPLTNISGESRCGAHLYKVTFDSTRRNLVPAGTYHIKVDANSFGLHEEDAVIKTGETLNRTIHFCDVSSSKPTKNPLQTTAKSLPHKPAFIASASTEMQMRPGEILPIPVWVVDESGFNIDTRQADINVENSGIASLNPDATIKAISPGETKLKIGLKNQKPQEITIKVEGDKLTGCRIISPTDRVRMGEMINLQAQASLQNGESVSGASLKWHSKDSYIATIIGEEGNARLYANHVGPVEILAEAFLAGSKTSCQTTITVEKAQTGRTSIISNKSLSSGFDKHSYPTVAQDKLSGSWTCSVTSSQADRKDTPINIEQSGEGYTLLLAGNIKTQGNRKLNNQYEFIFRSHNATNNLTLTLDDNGLIGEERQQNDDGSDQTFAVHCISQ